MNRILDQWTLLFLVGLIIAAVQNWKIALAVVVVAILVLIVGAMIAAENELESRRRAEKERKRKAERIEREWQERMTAIARDRSKNRHG